jgi:hypothetical protein
MLKNSRANKYEQPYSGPYCITQVNMNGTVCLKISAVTDAVNTRCIHALKTPSFNGGESAVCTELEIGRHKLVSDNLNQLV